MKRALTVIAVLVAVSVCTTSAGAATPQGKQIKTLQTQVKTLQKQVKTLQKQMGIVTVGLNYSFAATTCALAETADVFQSTWTALDSAGIVGMPNFTSVSTPALSDFNACANLKLTRGSGLTTPSWTAYNALIVWLYGPA